MREISNYVLILKKE